MKNINKYIVAGSTIMYINNINATEEKKEKLNIQVNFYKYKKGTDKDVSNGKLAILNSLNESINTNDFETDKTTYNIKLNIKDNKLDYASYNNLFPDNLKGNILIVMFSGFMQGTKGNIAPETLTVKFPDTKGADSIMEYKDYTDKNKWAENELINMLRYTSKLGELNVYYVDIDDLGLVTPGTGSGDESNSNTNNNNNNQTTNKKSKCKCSGK